MGSDHDHDPHDAAPPRGRALRLGIGGPVGSGKTALTAALCRSLRDELALAVVTNDIYTTEDADFLRRNAVLSDDRIVAVRTGCCPHTAIRDDISANLDAVESLEARHGPLDLVIVESGGDNLTATFSQGLVDRQIFVLDVSGGDKVPRKGGPGVTTSDLLVVNKTDLAELVGADLDVMAHDAGKVRGGRPVAFTSLRERPGAPSVTEWVREILSEHRAAHRHAADPARAERPADPVDAGSAIRQADPVDAGSAVRQADPTDAEPAVRQAHPVDAEPAVRQAHPTDAEPAVRPAGPTDATAS